MRDVDVLRPNERKLRLVLERVHRRVPQKRDHRQKELRPDDVHLRVAVEDVDDPGVVKFAVGFEQGDQHRILAPLLGAILVELLQEVLVLVLCRGPIALVLHLEHDRDDLGASLIRVAKDVVALAASPRVVVLLEIRPRKGRRANPVELGLAVLFQGLADHLGRQASLHVPEALDRVITILDLRFVLVLERLLGELLLKLRLLEAALQLVALLLDRTDRFGDRELLLELDTFDLGLQVLDLRVLRSGGTSAVRLRASPRLAR